MADTSNNNVSTISNTTNFNDANSPQGHVNIFLSPSAQITFTQGCNVPVTINTNRESTRLANCLNGVTVSADENSNITITTTANTLNNYFVASCHPYKDYYNNHDYDDNGGEGFGN